jgi:arginyl-tRNA synthetase
VNPAVLAEKVRATAVEVLADRGLDSTVLPETVRLERPRNPSHGDYATSIALQVSKQIGVSSLVLAGWLAEALTAAGEVEDAQVAGPGFLNLRLATATLGDIVVDVETAAVRYGRGTRLAGRKIKVEFGGIGLIDVDSARVIATGDALARVLAAQGAEVSREYVFAETGEAVDRFVDSLIAAASGDSTPDGGYAGAYIADIAAEVLRREPGALTDRETFRRLGTGLMADQVRAGLQDFRVELGPDLDVEESIRLTGSPVRLVKDGKPVLMSNRAGNVVTLEDMAGVVGVDATRYALARTPLDSPADIDLDLLDAMVRPNPVFLVRYAHARTCRVVENSARFGTKFGTNVHSADLGLLAHESERSAIRTLGEFPEVVATAAELREPHRVCRFLEDLAGASHRWYDTPGCTILPKGDDEVAPVHLARLRLARAVRQVLVNGLEMLGVSAPERM